jgi:HCOMODA/2-hydroxy-3-carboxy-muconic semialdehyde decarboxylase
LATAADIIEYDLDSNPAAGDDRTGYRERFIHGEIYKARPDVMAVVHDHSPAVIPFSVSSVPLRAVSHMAAFIGEGIPVFEIRDVDGMTDMLVSSPKRGRALATVLGKFPAALMRGHGAAVVGESVKVAVGRAIYLDLNARVQEQAMLLGGTVKYFEPEEARKTAPQDGFERAWDVWKRKAAK